MARRCPVPGQISSLELRSHSSPTGLLEITRAQTRAKCGGGGSGSANCENGRMHGHGINVRDELEGSDEFNQNINAPLSLHHSCCVSRLDNSIPSQRRRVCHRRRCPLVAYPLPNSAIDAQRRTAPAALDQLTAIPVNCNIRAGILVVNNLIGDQSRGPARVSYWSYRVTM